MSVSKLGDMVVSITGENKEFDNSIDKSAQKFKSMQQIIATGAVDLAKSFKQLDGEAALWGNSTDLLKQKQAVLKKEMSRLISEGIDPTGKETEKLMNKYYALGNEIIALEKKQKKWQDTLKESSAEASKIGGKLSLFVTAPLLAAGVAAVKSAANMEMLQASFETMLGSAEKASALMSELKDLASKTPFEVTGLAEASKTLLQFGIQNEKVIPTLKMLGDISGGNAAKLSSLALVFGQIQSTGRLMGQDLLQLVNAGFNPLQVISEKTGKSMAQLKDEMSKGAISAAEVADAFKIATSEGGRFFNGMAIASKTLSGLTSTLNDDIGSLGRSFVEDLMPIIKETVKSLSSLAQGLSKLSPETKQSILIIGGFAAALGPAILGVTGITKGIVALNAGLLANPIVAVTTALVALGTVAALTANHIRNARENTENLNKVLAGGTTGDYRKDLDLINKALEALNIELVQSNSIYAEGNPVIAEQIALLKQAKLETELRLQGQRAGRTLQVDQNKLDSDAAVLAERKLKLEDQYKKSRELILKTLEDEKSEYQKIQDQIDILSKTPWAKGELETQRLVALQALRDKQIAIINEASARLIAAEKENTTVIQTEAGKRALALAQQESARLNTVQQFNDLSKSSTQLQIEQINKQRDAFIAAGVSEVEANAWANKEIIDVRLDTFNQILSMTGNLVSQLQSLYQMDVQNQLDAINAKLEADLAALDEQLEAALEAAGVADETEKEKQTRILAELKKELAAAKTAEDKAAIEEKIREAEKALKKAEIIEEFDAKKEQLEKDAALATYKIEKAAFETNQKLSIIQTVIDTAELAVKAYKALAGIPIIGPGLGLAAAAAATAFGLAKIALIKQQVGPQPPALAEGGIVQPKNGGTDVIVGEAGVPEVVIPLDRLGEVLNNFLGNNNNVIDETPIHLVVQMDSKSILDQIFPATKNRTVLISASAVVG